MTIFPDLEGVSFYFKNIHCSLHRQFSAHCYSNGEKSKFYDNFLKTRNVLPESLKISNEEFYLNFNIASTLIKVDISLIYAFF